MLQRILLLTVSTAALLASCATTSSPASRVREQLESVGSPHIATATPAQAGVKGPAAVDIDLDSLYGVSAEPNSAPAASTSDEGSRQGRWEFTAGGAGRNDKNFNAGGFSAGLGLGVFLSDGWELWFRQDIEYSKSAGTNVDWESRMALDYNFGHGPLVPFIGANVGYVYGDSVRDTWEAGPEAGLKWYVGDHAFLQLLAEYEFFFKNEDAIGTAFDDGQFVYSLGVGVGF